MDYFASIGYPCPEYSNPADYYIELVHTESPKENRKLEILVENYDQRRAPLIKDQISQVNTTELTMKTVEKGFFEAI